MPSSDDQTIPTVNTLAGRLGMTSGDVESFQSGNIVTEERDASNDKDLCLLVAVMLPASLEKVWDFIIAEKVPTIQDATLSQGKINLETFELENFNFDNSHGAITSDLLSKYNLSKKESSELSKSSDKQSAFLRILSDRAKVFWQQGIKGIVPYEGKNHDVAKDLETANAACLKVIENADVREEITAIPSKSKNPSFHGLVWSIVQGNSSTNIVLSHTIRISKGSKALCSITRKFYSGTDFDSSMITVGALPVSKPDNHTAVFYVNHTYSPAVAGFGGGAKRSIGRKMMKGALVETMKKAQKALA